MRKISIAILVLALVLVLNFVFWFSHTRTINAALVNLKKELGVIGVKVSYDDLFYNNFKSWNVEGVISNLKISSDRFVNGQLIVKRVVFSSQPFKEHIELRSEDEVLLSMKTIAGEDEYQVKFPNGNPTIEVDFNTSLKSLNDAISGESFNLFSQVKRIEYYDSGIDLIDLKAHDKYLSISSSKLGLKAKQQEEKELYEILLNYKDLKYNPEFKGVAGTKVISENNIRRGAQNANVDFIIDCTVSEKQKEYRKKNDIKGGPVFDTYDVHISDFTFANEQFKFTATGNVRKSLGVFLPIVNLKVYVSEYKKLIAEYVSAMNSIIKEKPEIAAFLPYRALEDAQIIRVEDLFGRFKKNETDLEFTLTREENKEFMISDVPALLFMTEIQNILGSTVDNKSARTGLEGRLEQRRARVVK